MNILIGALYLSAMVFAVMDEEKDWTDVAAWGSALLWFILFAWREIP